MSTYPIELTSLSFNDIKQNIIDFVTSKPDANRWRDFYTGGEGTILIELIAGYSYYTAIKILFSREETYLAYANTLLSARAMALNSAYSAFRGTNRRYRIKFVSKITAAIPAFTVIGSQGDYDFICLEDVTITAGEECEVYGAVGVFGSLSMEVPSADLHVFRFNDDLISNDYKLYLNGNELPTTAINAEALEDKYLVQSNAAGGVNVTYLNIEESFTHKYQTGDALKIDYIQYQNIPYSSEILIDYADEVEVISTENTVVPESLESIQAKAPIMYETQQLIRSREDYVKNLMNLYSKFVDTTGRDLSAAYVELSYVLKDQMLLTQDETNKILKALTYKRMFGIPLPYINKPRYMEVKLNVNLKLSNSNIILAKYNDIVAARMMDYEYKFSDQLEEVIIDLAETERLLEQEDNVKRAYITVNVESFRESDYYQLGDVFASDKEEYIYRATNIMYETSAEEPEWNYELGSLTEDSNIIWQAVPQSGHPTRWNPKEYVELYGLRLPSESKVEGIMFRAIEGKSVSNPIEEPEWNSVIGDITYDAELIWKAVEYVATAPEWKPNTWYNLGDIIRSGANSYQVIGERRKSASVAPELEGDPDEIIHEGMLFIKEVLDDEKISLPWGTYFVIKPTVSASIQ